ncbi:exported protein of unknown function [Pseudomonas sp. JV551A1]|uniref:Uncharacterized protein n=1 Tax=Pseudomonas inefficax TaxID=2078786 RepID=A0AAQ1SSE9_9PSED|nr:exported protein of unknown function [Pseudomonas sp. JV551A1]SPO59830.1 exported protein of unknown function [Pseudomonas inefficax]
MARYTFDIGFAWAILGLLCSPSRHKAAPTEDRDRLHDRAPCRSGLVSRKGRKAPPAILRGNPWSPHTKTPRDHRGV